MTSCYDQNRQVFNYYRLNYQRFPTLGLYLMFVLSRIQVYWGFSLYRFHYTKLIQCQFMQVNLTKISYVRTLFKVRIIQDSGLLRIRFRQVSLYKFIIFVYWLIVNVIGSNSFVKIHNILLLTELRYRYIPEIYSQNLISIY